MASKKWGMGQAGGSGEEAHKVIPREDATRGGSRAPSRMLGRLDWPVAQPLPLSGPFWGTATFRVSRAPSH